MESEAKCDLPKIDALWNYAEPGETERKFRDLLPAAEASGNLSYLLQLETQIARTEGLQGHFTECHRTLDGVEKRLTEESGVARVRYRLERGRAFNSAEQATRAIPLFMEAFNLATTLQEWRLAIDAAHMVAIADADLAAQVAWNQKALRLIDEYPEQRGWLNAIYNNLGETYRARGEYAQGLECFEKLAELHRDAGRDPDIYGQKDIAKMLRLLGRVEEGLRVIEPIALDLHKRNTDDGYISAEYGQCLAAFGRIDEAKPYLRQAYQALSQDPYMVSKEPEELQRLKTLCAAN